MKETIKKTETGAILYDRSLLNHISDASFTAEGWRAAERMQGRLRSAGRGNTLIVGDGERELVLKHYVRGGLPRRFVRDRYLWSGEARTRAFAECRLLAKLCDMGLPVPRPVAARYRRHGLLYSADLLTLRLPGIEPLSARLARAPGDDALWDRVGRTIRRFHDAGVHHADLNAYNVQVNDDDDVFLLDFDRGAIRKAGGGWGRENLARLHRSLRKLKQLDPDLRFDEGGWRTLLEAYGRGR